MMCNTASRLLQTTVRTAIQFCARLFSCSNHKYAGLLLTKRLAWPGSRPVEFIDVAMSLILVGVIGIPEGILGQFW